MALKITRTEVWMASIDDRAGGAADKLEALARAGADLQFVFTRRTPEQPGRGLMFAWPIKGKKAVEAAQMAGFSANNSMQGLRLEGGDKAGLGAKIARAMGNAGVSFRGMSATAIGSKFASHILFDSADDAARAAAALKKV